MARSPLVTRLLAPALLAAAAAAFPQSDDPAPEALERYRETLRTSDLPEMTRHRQVRALVVYEFVAEQEARRAAARGRLKAQDAPKLPAVGEES